MNIDIFVRTYNKDIPWLLYLLKSIQKFSTGYNQIVIVAPESQRNEFEALNLTKEKLYFTEEPSGINPYLLQQLSKVNADCFTEAEYICYLDSDCFFYRPFNIQEELFKDGKPILMKTPYKDLPPEVPWKPITERVVGFPVEYETMRRHPMLYPSSILQPFRAHIEMVHGKSINDYVASVKEISEFNAMGSYALKYHANKFSELDTSKDPVPREWVFQAWSWGGLTPEIKAKYDRLLAS